MKVVIAGGTGFLGRALAEALAVDEHDVVILTRRHSAQMARYGGRQVYLVRWDPDGQVEPWADEIDGAGAVVNLAGESIGDRRWSKARKAVILQSRLLATRSLVAAISAVAARPTIFVSASAVGYYGPLDDRIATEDTPPGSDFLANVCVQWEGEAVRAASPRTRVVCIRTGLVLDGTGGALPRMLIPFRVGLGGRIGSGLQYWPWIHRQDWVDLVRWTLATPAVSGPVNATAPAPVTNMEFSRALGRAMHRPALMPAPASVLRLILGEMADGLLLAGQRAMPAKAQRLGFKFRFERVEDAFAAVFSGRPKAKARRAFHPASRP